MTGQLNLASSVPGSKSKPPFECPDYHTPKVGLQRGHTLKVAGNEIKMCLTYFGRSQLYKNHPRHGNTLRHLHSILSVNADGYIFIKNTRNKRMYAWIWSGYQGTHQLNFNEMR